MFWHTMVVMLHFVIRGEFCIIKQESAPLESFGQGAFEEMSGQSTPYPMEPDHVRIETVYGEGQERSKKAFIYRLEQGIRVWAPQNINGMSIESLKPFPAESVQTVIWNSTRLKLKNLKLSAYIVGVTTLENYRNTKNCKYFFVILNYGHLKLIQRSIGDEESAKIAAETYINDPEFERIIHDPIWKTNGNAVLQKSAPISVIPKRHCGEGYKVLSCWKLSCEPGIDRYITMLKHESDHAHWFFVSALMFKDEHKSTQINYVGGYMNSPWMAEISVINFMNLSPEIKNGIWSDSTSQPGTWNCGSTDISWKPEKPRNAINDSIKKIVTCDNFRGPKELTKVVVSYYFAYGTRHMPCPISPEEYFMYLFHSIDYFWITVQIPDKDGVHLISIVHRYLDNIYYDTILEEYSDYYPVEATISVSDTDGKKIATDENGLSKTLNHTSGQSEKRKSTNLMANLFQPRRILNRTKSLFEKKKSTNQIPIWNRSKSDSEISKINPPP